MNEVSTPFVPPVTTTLASASCWWCVKTGKPKVGNPEVQAGLAGLVAYPNIDVRVS